MFDNYSTSQLIGVLEWFGIVFALGTGVYFASAKATYVFFGKKNKKIKVRAKSNIKKKQVFFDVA
jgi:hypothetical protein